LEFSERPAPPVLERLPDASERTLRERWDRIENELHEIVDYVKRVDADVRSKRRAAASFRSLKRTVRELDQYARALRWVLTVTEQDPAE
jgi:intergrase/recombinase